MHGFGTETYLDGSVYAGHWENDKQHGQGTLKNAEGDVIYQGEWMHGNKLKRDLSGIEEGDLDEECASGEK